MTEAPDEAWRDLDQAFADTAPTVPDGAEIPPRKDNVTHFPIAKAKAPPQNKTGDDRPTIELLVGKTERAVNELERLLVASDRGLYQRGGLIVSTGFAKMRTWDGEEVVGQVIETRGDYALLEDAEAVAKFVRLNEKGVPRPCPAPMALIHTLKDRKLRLRLPTLSGIVNCPSITIDGRVLDKPGYDPATGVLYDPLGVSFPPVPDFPDRAQAEAAMNALLSLLHTFDFETDRRQGCSTIAHLQRRRAPRVAVRPAAWLRCSGRWIRQVDAGRPRLNPRHRP